MPQKSDATVHILEKKATLFKRTLTPHWHVRFKAHGKWYRVTTKTDDLKEAKDVAVKIVTKAWHREEDNLPIVSKRFKNVAHLAIQRMKDAESARQGKATYKTYIQVLEKYLIPFFGNYNIDNITQALMNDFDKWRVIEMNTKREKKNKDNPRKKLAVTVAKPSEMRLPSASVINNHNSALNRVFDEALERGYMTKLQLPFLRNEGVKSEKRPTITVDEYTTLHRGLKSWVEDARSGNETKLRNILRDYILILSHTGIRSGTEAMNLKWHDVNFFTKSKVQYLGIRVNGKTGERHVTVRHAAIRYFDRLRSMNAKYAKVSFSDFLKARHDSYVFRVEGKTRSGEVVYKDMTTAFGRMFSRYLERVGLHIDKSTQKPRTLYSLRHMYATFALTYDRMSVYTLAEHMGTSVKMIEDHYGQLLLKDKAAEIAGDKEFFLAKAKREEAKQKKLDRQAQEAVLK